MSKLLLTILVKLSQMVVGAIFVFSGFVKMVDPAGFGYKIQDYLVSMNLPWLVPLALIGAVALSVFEFMLGMCMLFGIHRRLTSMAVLALMLVMTPLTLWVAIANPVEDCGCFGDAIVIDNWTTFYKNLVLTAMAALVFFKYKLMMMHNRSMQTAVAIIIMLCALSFAILNIVSLPVIDFRPYKVGASITEQMQVDVENADVYENLFVYEKDGVKKEFTEDNYPWNDSTWTFVDMTTRLVKKGKEPEIADFHIFLLSSDTESGQYEEVGEITDDILNDTTYTFLLVAYSVHDIKSKNIEAVTQMADFARANDYRFYCLTASPTSTISEWVAETGADLTFCHADERMLKTMIRSSPGVVLLKEGTVINKWSRHTMSHFKLYEPFCNELEASSLSGRMKVWYMEHNEVLNILLICLLYIVPFVGLVLIEIRQNRKRNR